MELSEVGSIKVDQTYFELYVEFELSFDKAKQNKRDTRFYPLFVQGCFFGNA